MLNLHFLKEGQIHCTPLNKPVPFFRSSTSHKKEFLSLRLLSTETRVRGQSPSVSDTKISHPPYPSVSEAESNVLCMTCYALIKKGLCSQFLEIRQGKVQKSFDFYFFKSDQKLFDRGRCFLNEFVLLIIVQLEEAIWTK